MTEPSVAPESTNPIISLRIAYPSSILFSSTLATRPPSTRTTRKLRKSSACQRIPANTSRRFWPSISNCFAIFLYISFLCDEPKNWSADSGGYARKRYARWRLRRCERPALLRNEAMLPSRPLLLSAHRKAANSDALHARSRSKSWQGSEINSSKSRCSSSGRDSQAL